MFGTPTEMSRRLELIVGWAGPAASSAAMDLVRGGAVSVGGRRSGRWEYAYVLDNAQEHLVRRAWDSETERFSCDCDEKRPCTHMAAALFQELAEHDPRILSTPVTGETKANGGLPTEVVRWLDDVGKAQTHPRGDGYPPGIQDRLLYVLGASQAESGRLDRLQVIHTRKLLRRGGFSASRKPFNGWDDEYYSYSYRPAPSKPFVLQADKDIRRELRLAQCERRDRGFALEAKDLSPVLRAVVETGRCYLDSIDGAALALGPPRSGRLAWRTQADGYQRLTMECDPEASHLIASATPWYLDAATRTCGPIDTDVAQGVLSTLLQAPLLKPEDAGRLSANLAGGSLGAVVPRPRNIPTETVQDRSPIPVLRLRWQRLYDTDQYLYSHHTNSGPRHRCWAEVSFDYGDGLSAEEDTPAELSRYGDGRLTVIKRLAEEEKSRLAQIAQSAYLTRRRSPQYVFDADDAMDPGIDWLEFQNRDLPALRKNGWRVSIDEGHPYFLTEHRWRCSVTPGESSDWFDVGLGIEIDGKTVDMVPVLLDHLMERDFRREIAESEGQPEKQWFLKIDDNHWITLPAARAMQLMQLFTEIEELRAGGTPKLSRYDLGVIAGLDEFDAVRFEGGEQLRKLAHELTGEEPSTYPVPASLEEVLRPYQRIGFQWLQQRGANSLGCVLADDVGLGKTLQVQAHLLAEKLAGRAGAPSLIIVTRSVLKKWAKEIDKFTPQLRALTLHGQDRHDQYSDIDHHDVVLTTYAMLIRDIDKLKERQWHGVVLDEAHNIRNASTKAASAACMLKCHHRIALSATPMQNSLSDLWSIMHFAVPGLLRNEKWFREKLKRPIEQNEDVSRQKILKRLIRPFLLRRTKPEVQAELPPLTETTRMITLEGKQRDLYEVVRASMEQKVRSEIAAKGFNRSRVIVLHALLQLRQVCCDPRLLKLKSAKDCESAKLEACRKLIAELIAEGRKVLLFSNFTSVLDLLKDELDKIGITWAEIVGDTKDREKPQEAFRAGQAKVLLVSEKAGGEGLDLQAADTVLLYEPWWNPFAETQAAGRAHRSGQDKPVLLIRLIVEGSVEERMLAMQAKKQGLVDAILSESPSKIEVLSEDDVNLLLAPLEREDE